MSNYISIHTGTQIDDAVTKVNADNLVANKAIITNSSNKLASSSITDTELSYLSGVSGAIQTQINNKLNSSSYTANDVLSKLLTVDGTGSGLDAEYFQGSTPLAFASSGHTHSNYEPTLTKGNLSGTTSQILVTGGTGSVIGSGASISLASTPIISGLEISSTTINTVPIINTLKQIASSAVSSTELGYLSGVTSSIQNQINKIGTYKVVASSGGDYTTLSAAIAANETRIYIKAGTYNEGTNKIEIRNNNTYILGENKENTIINFTGNGELRLYANNCIINGIQSVAVEGAAFVIGDGSATATPVSTVGCNNIIENCKFIGGSTTFCFYVAGASYERYSKTLDAYNSKDLQADNVISNCHMESSFIGDGFAISLQKNFKFINNICKGARLSFYMNRESYCEYNQFIDSNGVGLYLAGVGNNNNINHNLIVNATTIGLKSKNESEHDPLYAGMGFQDNNITHNIIYGTGLSGISIEGVSDNPTMYNNVSNNVVKNAGDSGIYLLYSDYNNVSNNIIDTPRYDLGNTRGSGIYIVIAKYNNIKNNTVIDTRTVGNGCAGGIIDRENTGNIGNIIEDNQLYCINNERTIWIQGDYTIVKNNYITGGYYGGIQLKGANHCIVQNNISKNNTNYGNDVFGEIWLTDSADYNIVKYNHLESTATNKAKIDVFDESGSSNNTFGFNTNYGCLTTHIDNIVLENSAAYQIKNSSGTAKNAVKLTAGNVLEIGDTTGNINIPSLTASKALSLDSSKNIVSLFATQDLGTTSSPTFYKVDAVNDTNGVWNYTITSTPVPIHAGFYQGDMYGEYGVFYGTKDNIKTPLWFGQNAGETISLTINTDGSVKFNQLTASTVPYIDSNKKIVSSSVTNTELSYLSGVTSSIQTQINNMGGSVTTGDLTSTTLTVTNGTDAVVGSGTQINLPSTPIVSNLTITDLIANRALVSNTDKQVVSTSVTNTELGYLSGVTSGIQSQFNKTLEEVDTVANVKLKGIANNRNVYCRATNTIYTYLASGASYVANDFNILTTADGGNTRWIAIQDMLYTNLQTATYSGTGFLSRTTTSMSIVGQNFTIAPTGSSFDIYINGTKHVKTSSSVTLPLTVGMHYIYFDTSATLVSSMTPWEIPSSKVFVAGAYCNGNEYTILDERHGANRNMDWHRWAHYTIGTRFETGLVGTFSTSATSFTSGKIHDEDIANVIPSQSGNCVLMWYRNPTNFYFAATPIAVTANIVAGALKYDNAGTLTSVSNNQYTTNFIYATNDITNPIYMVTGQASYSSQANAEAATLPDFANFPSMEMKLIYAVVWRNASGTPTYISNKDYRFSAGLPGGGTTVTNASSVAYIPYSTISSTNVQAAIQELTDESVTSSSVSSVDNSIVRMDSTTGKIIQTSLATIDDSGSINIPTGQTYKINNVSLTYTDVGAAASSHSHGNLTNDGAIGSTSGLPIITTTSGVLTTGSFGTTAGTFCQGNDSRLSGIGYNSYSITFDNSGTGGSSGITYNGSTPVSISYNTIGAAPLSHSHGNITNAGAIGSTSGLPVVTTTSGVLTTGTYGTLTGTTDQVNLSASGSNVLNGTSITLSLPQSIALASTPQFANLGLGVEANANYKIYSTYAIDNTSNIYGINLVDTSKTTTTGSHARYGFVYNSTGTYVALSQTCSSIGWMGIDVKHSINSTSHRGTLDNQTGVNVTVGITNCGASGTITNSYGYKSTLNCSDADGTITSGYLYYGTFNYSAGTATNRYGIYMTGETKNYLSGTLETGGNITVGGLTASMAVVTDANKVLTSSTTTSTQIGYLNSVTGNVQTQIDGKAPTSHAVNASTYGYGDATNAGHLRTGTGISVTTGTISVAYGTSSSTACVGNDSRLSNTRNTTNSLTFDNSGTGGASGSTFNGSAALTVSYNTVGAAPLSHTHGNITNAGAIGSTADLPVFTTTSGVLTTLSASNACSALGVGTEDSPTFTGGNFTSNVNIGSGTLSAWSTSYRAIEFYSTGLFASNSSASIHLASNMYYNQSAQYIYKTSDYASRYQQINGTHLWYYAASGTAGNAISWLTLMASDTNGCLGLGAAPSVNFRLNIEYNTTDSNSKYAIGTGVVSTSTVNGTYTTGGAYFQSRVVVPTGVTNSGDLFGIRTDALANSATHQGIITNLYGGYFKAGLYTCGVGGAATNAYGVMADITRNDADGTVTNAYALYGTYTGSLGTITNKWGLYVTGEDKNYLSGNLGIGTTDIEAWHTNYKVIEFYGSAILGSSAGSNIIINSNSYYDGATKYKADGTASQYNQTSGTHLFRVATSGTADATITWNTAMTINNSGNSQFGGNIGIGVIPEINYKLYITQSSTNQNLARSIYSTPTYISNSAGTYNDTGLYINMVNSYCSANNAGGYAGIGTDAHISTASHTATLALQYGVYSTSGIASCGTGGSITTSYNIYAESYCNDADATITNSYLFYGKHNHTLGTVTNKWGLYLSGETKNYMSGHLGIGTSTIYTWNASYTALQIGGNANITANTTVGAGTTLYIYQNGYFHTDGTDKYISTDEASCYSLYNGAHVFSTAISGTAGNQITWHTALSIANSGIMTSKTIAGTGNALTLNTTDTSGAGHTCLIQGQNNGTTIWYVGCGSTANNNLQILNADAAGDIRFLTNNSSVPKMIIDINGFIGIGTTDIEAWSSTLDVIEFYRSAIFASNASEALYIGSNNYNDGAWKYKSADKASLITLNNGTCVISVTDTTGTVDGAITWTDALTVASTGNSTFGGNLGIGVTSNPLYTLYTSKTYLDSTGDVFGGYMSHVYQGTTATIRNTTGLLIAQEGSYIATGLTQTNSIGLQIYNRINSVNHLGTITNHKIIDLYGGIQSCGAGTTLTESSLINGTMYNADTDGTITSGYLLKLIWSGTSGTVTNKYGIYTTGQAINVIDGAIRVSGAVMETSQVGGINIKQGTDPTTNSIDQVTLYATAGASATLGLCTEATVVSESVTSDRTLSIKINGTVYKLCLKA